MCVYVGFHQFCSEESSMESFFKDNSKQYEQKRKYTGALDLKAHLVSMLGAEVPYIPIHPYGQMRLVPENSMGSTPLRSIVFFSWTRRGSPADINTEASNYGKSLFPLAWGPR